MGQRPKCPGLERRVLLAEQGVKILGAPLGHQDYAVSEQGFREAPDLAPAHWLSDVQSAWFLLHIQVH